MRSASLSYRLGLAVRRRPLLAAASVLIVVGAATFQARQVPPEPPAPAVAAWKAPVDPSDTPARRERRARDRAAADAAGGLKLSR